MRIGMVSLGMGASSLDDLLRFAQGAGCEVMEINGRSTVHQGLWQNGFDLAAIRAKIQASGIALTSLGGYSSLSQPTEGGLQEQVEGFIGYCELARSLEIPVVRAFAGDVVDGYTLDDLYPRLVQGFQAITDHVADWGIRIGIENHGHLVNSGDAIAALIHDVGSPILGVTLDTGNFCWAGHSIECAHAYIERLTPLAVNVHIKDGRFVDGRWVLFPAGRGELDLPAIMRHLRATGYDGPVLSEYEGHDGFGQSTLESVAYLRGLRDGLC